MDINGTNIEDVFSIEIEDDNATYSFIENEKLDWIRTFSQNFIPVFCIFGMLGNCMALMLIRRLTSNAYLSTLSISSCLFLFTVFITWTDIKYDVPLYNKSDIGCKIFTFLAHATDFVCVWMISWVSCDRMIVLYRPGIRKWVCTKKFGRRMVCATILSSIVAYSWCLICAGIEEDNNQQIFCGLNKNKTFFGKDMYFLFTMFDSVMCTIVPSILIVVVNSFAGYRYRQCMKIYSSGILRVRFLRGPEAENNNEYEDTTAKKLLLSQAAPTMTTPSTASGTLFLNNNALGRGVNCGKMRSSDLQLSRTLLVVTSPQMKKQLKPAAMRLLECYCCKTVPEFGHHSTSVNQFNRN